MEQGTSNTPSQTQEEATTPKGVLMLARSKLQKGWCQEANALTAAGEKCRGKDDVAASWCLLGAIRASQAASQPTGWG